MDDCSSGVIYAGPSAATMILAGLLVLLIVGVWAAWMSSPPPEPPKPPPPPPSPPPKAPSPPGGASEQVEAWLITMKAQIKTVAQPGYLRPIEDSLDTIIDPSSAHVIKLVKDYEKRVSAYAEKCRKMIEEPKK